VDQTEVEKAARRFLSKGVRGTLSESELAAACDRLVQDASRKSFKAALRVAEQLASRAENYGNPLRLAAHRCLARIKHLSGSHAEALELYTKARHLARRDPLIRARIDRVLIDVHMYLSQFDQSRKAARRAIATFTKMGEASDLAQTQANYGNLLHRLDRHKDAEVQYREAAEYFETTDNKVALARCYYNRANALVQLFDTETAEKLYVEAEKMYTEAGFSLDACDVRYGLAWLWMLTGLFHRALLELAECQRKYREGGDPRGDALCTLDRAEVFLSLNLHDDALSAARSAEKKFTKLGLRYERAKASLFRGQAALATGKRREANRAVERARTGFEAERNTGFVGVARLLSAELTANESEARRELKSARQLFSRSQLTYWEAVCDIKAIAARIRTNDSLRRLDNSRAVRQVPHLYALWQTLRGDIEARHGNLAAARRLWRRAADRIDIVRAQLPPLELRTAFGRRQSSPHVRLIHANMERDALYAAVWSERYKTAGVWSPVDSRNLEIEERTRVQESLSHLASQVSDLAHRIGSQFPDGNQRSSSLGTAATRLQKRVRQELMAVEDNEGVLPHSVEELANSFVSVSRETQIVQFHLRDHDIVAFVHQQGRARVRHFPGGRQRLASVFQRWRFLMERQLLSTRLQHAERDKAELALFEEIGNWLWRELRIDPGIENILIIPEGELANIPWGAVIVDSQPLIEHHRITMSPSLRHFMAAQKVRVDSSRVEIFRGDTPDIPKAAAETSWLTGRAGRDAVLHNSCTRDDWPVSGSARVWHYSGHAEMCEENPFYSYLVLNDSPLFAADFRLRNCSVDLVTLAACRSGEQVALPGEEATGLVRSLLEMGARNVIAGYWPVADESSSTWMKAFYDLYLDGRDIHDSIRQAVLAVREKYPSAYHWAAYSVTGAGDMGDRR